MNKYRIAVSSGLEGYLDFFDLTYKTKDGVTRIYRGQLDEIIPVEKFDKKIFENSLKSGCLFRAINAGWVQVLKGDKNPKDVKNEKTLAQKVGTTSLNPKDAKEIFENVNSDVRPVKVNEYATAYVTKNSIEKEAENESGTKLKEDKSKIEKNQINSYEDFNKLGYFLKLKFVKQTSNIDILNKIIDKTEVKQLKNNAEKKLKELKLKK